LTNHESASQNKLPAVKMTDGAGDRPAKERKDPMKRSFKVATVFTGATAFAAAFTPTAGAVTVSAKTQLIKPDIFKKNCTLGHPTTSVHFYWPAAAHHGPTCLGEAGTTSLGGTVFASFCAGNNYGWFSASGVHVPFGQSETLFVGAPVHQVHISHWQDSYKCPS
jgi:hypothetical protein